MAKKKKEPAFVLVYPTNNKFLRFYGDVMLLLGSLFYNHGIKFGGIYEFEDDND